MVPNTKPKEEKTNHDGSKHHVLVIQSTSLFKRASLEGNLEAATTHAKTHCIHVNFLVRQTNNEEKKGCKEKAIGRVSTFCSFTSEGILECSSGI
jgi:hypothetical protein